MIQDTYSHLQDNYKTNIIENKPFQKNKKESKQVPRLQLPNHVLFALSNKYPRQSFTKSQVEADIGAEIEDWELAVILDGKATPNINKVWAYNEQYSQYLAYKTINGEWEYSINNTRLKEKELYNQSIKELDGGGTHGYNSSEFSLSPSTAIDNNKEKTRFEDLVSEASLKQEAEQ